MHLKSGNFPFCVDQGDCTKGALRLVGGETEREGDVQICRDKIWGYICGYEWSSEEAKVACQQLGNSKTGEIENEGEKKRKREREKEREREKRE